MSRRDYEFEDFHGEYDSGYPRDHYNFGKSKNRRVNNTKSKYNINCDDDTWPEDDCDTDENNR